MRANRSLARTVARASMSIGIAVAGVGLSGGVAGADDPSGPGMCWPPGFVPLPVPC